MNASAHVLQPLRAGTRSVLPLLLISRRDGMSAGRSSAAGLLTEAPNVRKTLRFNLLLFEVWPIKASTESPDTMS